MKKILKITAIIMCVCMLFSACATGGAMPNGTNNINSTNSTQKLVTSYSRWGINYEITGSNLTIYGEMDSDWANYMMVTFNDRNDLTLTTPVNNRYFSLTADCSNFDSSTEVNLFAGTAAYGSFDGIVFDWIVVNKTNSGYSFEVSPVYNHNKAMSERYKNPNDYLAPEMDIQSDDFEIKSLAESITLGINNDYDRIKAVHKWVSENIYYDYDALRTGDYSNMDAKGVLTYKRGVCEGYSNLTAALLRSIGIPCRIQSGFGLGISTSGEWDSVSINTSRSNHAWNEAYAEGRWIILDTTWDSNNDYEYGAYNKGTFTTTNYFDSTMEFFSLSHKLIG